MYKTAQQQHKNWIYTFQLHLENQNLPVYLRRKMSLRHWRVRNGILKIGTRINETALQMYIQSDNYYTLQELEKSIR